MEKEQQFYILKPDGSINFLNLAFYTALHRQDWINNPENKEKIEGYSNQLPRPFKFSDIEALEIKYKVKFPMEFKEYIGKISREVFMFDFPVSIDYDKLEKAISLNSEVKIVGEEFLKGEINMESLVEIGKFEGKSDWIYLGGGKYYGSVWRCEEDKFQLLNISFREYILKPFQ